jgi:hypothetical protein
MIAFVISLFADFLLTVSTLIGLFADFFLLAVRTGNREGNGRGQRNIQELPAFAVLLHLYNRWFT